MISVGYDLGSSFLKCSFFDIEKGAVIASGKYPETEMELKSPAPGMAEQDPEAWLSHLAHLTKKLISENNIPTERIKCVGISYQMHGLVIVDTDQKVLRDSIIWCDSRAVAIGEQAFRQLGESYCLGSLLNSPGNFTLSKLKWVKENEPDIYKHIHKYMLPGDYLAMRLTGEISTTVSGVSEGIGWDFQKRALAIQLFEHFGIDEKLCAACLPSFANFGYVTDAASDLTGLPKGIPITYKAGDQPNNALSLNVLEPGEFAATAGTSGVIYAVTDKLQPDVFSRVNLFAHVNYGKNNNNLGALLCINGCAIANAWARRNICPELSYDAMNALAMTVAPGCEGLGFIPFGNGAERMLKNRESGAGFFDLRFTNHDRAHLIRAVHEGIAFAFKYGNGILTEMRIHTDVIRAGQGNLFLSEIFAQTLSTILNTPIEIYAADGAQGAARGAAFGYGAYSSLRDAAANQEKVKTYLPETKHIAALDHAYDIWLNQLTKILN